MARKRIVIMTQFEGSAEIDVDRLDRYFDGNVPPSAKLEVALARMIEEGNISVRGLLEGVGVEDTVEPYGNACCEVSLERECSKHPGRWAMHGGKCAHCLDEDRNGHRG